MEEYFVSVKIKVTPGASADTEAIEKAAQNAAHDLVSIINQRTIHTSHCDVAYEVIDPVVATE